MFTERERERKRERNLQCNSNEGGTTGSLYYQNCSF